MIRRQESSESKNHFGKGNVSLQYVRFEKDSYGVLALFLNDFVLLPVVDLEVTMILLWPNMKLDGVCLASSRFLYK
jgi:hypothetical protein